MQDFTKILPACARQHLLHKPRPHLCATAPICSTTHSLPRDSASKGRKVARHSRSLGLGHRPAALGPQSPALGCTGPGERAGSSRAARETGRNKALSPLFSMPWATEVWVLLLVTLMRWVSQRNPRLRGSARPVTGFALGAHLKCVW